MRRCDGCAGLTGFPGHGDERDCGGRWRGVGFCMRKVGLQMLIFAVAGAVLWGPSVDGGTWSDHFHKGLAPEWSGDNEAFRVTTNGVLEGVSANPVGVSPRYELELPMKLSNVVVSCWVNVVRPNTHVCTKGALVLRHDGTSGYIFALHQATQTIEVFRSFSGEMILIRSAEIKLGQWYHLRAELNGTVMRFFVDGTLVGSLNDDESSAGKFGVAVQDADAVLFDDFTLTGAEVVGNVDGIAVPEVELQGNGGEMTLRFATEAGYDYIVQKNSAPWQHNWMTVTNFTVKLQPVDAVIMVPANEPFTFYRVEKVNCWCD